VAAVACLALGRMRSVAAEALSGLRKELALEQAPAVGGLWGRRNDTRTASTPSGGWCRLIKPRTVGWLSRLGAKPFKSLMVPFNHQQATSLSTWDAVWIHRQIVTARLPGGSLS